MQLDLIVAQNFAHALFNVVEKSGLGMDSALQEVEALEELLRKQPKFYVFLTGPQFRTEDKIELATKALHGKLEKTFFLMVLLLIKRNRPEYLLLVLERFKDLVEKANGIVSGTVTTAVPLSSEDEDAVTKKLEAYCGKTFRFEFKVNPQLIGGIQVKYGDTLMDYTIARQLGDLRNRLKFARIAASA